jgi:TonB-linked SusC/RagA family outer membrane protein
MNYGTDYQKTREGFFEGRLSSSRQFSDPRASKILKSTKVTTFENILTYNKQINESNKITATGLFSIQESNYEMSAIDVEGLPYEHQLFHNLSTAEKVLAYDSDLQEWGIMSFMGRLNYNLKDKYLLTLTARYDGSSRLAEGKKWGLFPSVALMWNIGNEGFLENQETITDLRLRASYGVTGNTGIDPYQTRGALGRSVYSFGGSSGTGYRPSVIANADLQWETSATANIGLDFGIGQYISGSVEVYQTNTTDLLLERKLPITSGYDNILSNIGETQNQGWEITLNAQLADTEDFSWSTNLNLFGNKEKIVDLYGDKEDDVGNEWFIGEPLTVWYDYRKIGVWQLGEEDQAAQYQVTPGVIKVEDVNNDGLINQDDRQILGSNIPEITLGFGSRVEYKNVDLSFLLFGVFGQTVFNEFEDNFATLQGRFNNLNVDYWTPDNPTNDQPMADGSRERPLYNATRAYQKGDFLKVKNIQLGYNFPKNTLSKIGLKNLRLFVNADTPFIFSKVADKGLDPESYDGRINGRIPTVKMYSMGINIDF